MCCCFFFFFGLLGSDDGGLLLGFVRGGGGGGGLLVFVSGGDGGLWKRVLVVWVVLPGSSFAGGFVPFVGFLWQRGSEKEINILKNE